MLGPHYAPELDKYQNLAKPFNVPVVVIPQDIYSQLDGARLIDLAIETIKNNK